MRERTLYVGCLISFLLVIYAQVVSAQKADTSSVECVEVFFNMPADHSVAKDKNLANDEADLLQTLIAVIDSAKYSVDLSVYDLENLKVGEALVRAAERGVRVRVVTDYYNRFNDRELDEKMWEMLRSIVLMSAERCFSRMDPLDRIV